MKKIYLLLFSISVGFFGSAQQSNQKELVVREEYTEHKIKPSNNLNQPKGVVLWSNEFDNSADWVLDNTGTVAVDPNTGQPAHWVFESDPNVIPVSALAPFGAATASNGFIFINSDACGGGDGDGTPIFVTATIAAPIDLSAEPSCVISFSHNYRWWHDSRGVRVSGDNGATWTDFPVTSDQGGVIPNGYPNNQNTDNPEITSFDISSVVGYSSQALIQFYYEDNDYWAWYWAVDDVKISRKDQNNVQNMSSWIYGESTYGAEYGRTPVAHADANWYVGAQVSNDGVNDQTNVTLSADFGSFTTTSSIAVVQADSTEYIESLEPISVTAGVYQGVFTVSSDSDQVSGANFGDNTYDRSFEITTDVYSLDGIGNHPAGYEALGSLGSNSWPTDASDGLVCATMYPIKQAEVVNSVRAYITSSTVAQSEVVLYIIDSLSFTSGMFGSAVYTSELYTVTTNDVANGYIEIPVANNTGWDPVNNTTTWENLTLQAGNYYAGLELFSGGNTFDIRIVDDATVNQPAWSSAIWYPGDQAYTNGNAFAIRLNLGDNVNVNETTQNEISIYPNPSNGVINITNNGTDKNSILVRDISGKVILSTNSNVNATIDLTKYGKGIYIVEVSNSVGTVTEKVTIQ